MPYFQKNSQASAFHPSINTSVQFLALKFVHKREKHSRKWKNAHPLSQNLEWVCQSQCCSFVSQIAKLSGKTSIAKLAKLRAQM